MSKHKEIKTIEQAPSIIQNTIDFDEVLAQAIKPFAKQAELAASDQDISLAELNIAKQQSENYLAAVAGIIELSNKVELLKADSQKFKRDNELVILNRLKDQYDKVSNYNEKQLDALITALENELLSLSDNPDPTVLNRIEGFQKLLDYTVKRLDRVSDGFGKLMKTERETGGRSLTNNSGFTVSTTLANSLTAPTSSDNNSNGSGKNVPIKIDLKDLPLALEESKQVDVTDHSMSFHKSIAKTRTEQEERLQNIQEKLDVVEPLGEQNVRIDGAEGGSLDDLDIPLEEEQEDFVLVDDVLDDSNNNEATEQERQDIEDEESLGVKESVAPDTEMLLDLDFGDDLIDSDDNV